MGKSCQMRAENEFQMEGYISVLKWKETLALKRSYWAMWEWWGAGTGGYGMPLKCQGFAVIGALTSIVRSFMKWLLVCIGPTAGYGSSRDFWEGVGSKIQIRGNCYRSIGFGEYCRPQYHRVTELREEWIRVVQCDRWRQDGRTIVHSKIDFVENQKFLEKRILLSWKWGKQYIP